MPRLLVFIVFVTQALAGGAQVFTEVSDDAGVNVSYGQCFLAGGISFTDYDMDGDDDLLMPSCDELGLFIYRNTDGFFSLDTAAVFANVQGRSKAVYAVDLDNDGDRELFITRLDTTNVLLWNHGNGYTDVSSAAGIDDNDYDSFSACFADYDRDGYLDIYVGNRATISVGMRNILYRNKGDGTFEEKTFEAGVADVNGAALAVAFIEVNNDGWPDIYVANDKLSGNVVYLNNGDGTFADISSSSGANTEMDGMSVSCTDFNQDGYLDIYVTNTELMGNKFFVNNQDNTYTESAEEEVLQVFKGSWGSVFIDYDNDGDEDLFVPTMTPAINNTNVFFILDNGEFINISGLLIPEILAQSMGAAKADYDQDGDYDLVVQNGDWTNVELLNNGSAPGNYVSVELQGLWSNREGVGSWIEVFCNGEVFRRYTQLGCNFAGQDSKRILLGLGGHSEIDSIKVQWPSGIVQVETGLNTGAHHLIVESIPNGLPQANRSKTTITPNPVKDVLSLNVGAKSGEPLEIEIRNLSGQLVLARRLTNHRTVDVGFLPAGIYLVSWIDGGELGRVRFIKN